MEITEVRIFPRESKDRKLKAYATVTFDDSFVVRDIKVIEGNNGFFVAMPSRKLKISCPKCGHRNVAESKYCNQCGSSLPAVDQQLKSKEDRQREHRDIAHPINSQFRDYLQKTVMEEYEQESGIKSDETREQLQEHDRVTEIEEPSASEPSAEEPDTFEEKEKPEG